MMPAELKGIIGIPLTPFNTANEFDPGPLREQVDFFIRRKAADLFYSVNPSLGIAEPTPIEHN